jgi:CheY-like chemotaxis protein
MKCGTCILIEDDLDDQELFLDALHSVTSKTGCYVVSNGEDALFTLLNEGITPDYIFSDINMPRMGGFEFLRILKGIEKFRHIPVIFLTGELTDYYIEQAKIAGAVAILSKTRPDALKIILSKYFPGSSGREHYSLKTQTNSFNNFSPNTEHIKRCH